MIWFADDGEVSSGEIHHGDDPVDHVADVVDAIGLLAADAAWAEAARDDRDRAGWVHSGGGHDRRRAAGRG